MNQQSNGFFIFLMNRVLLVTMRSLDLPFRSYHIVVIKALEIPCVPTKMRSKKQRINQKTEDIQIRVSTSCGRLTMHYLQ